MEAIGELQFEGRWIVTYLRLGARCIGVDPTAVAGQAGDAAFPVYADRATGGVCEEVVLTPLEGGQFSVLFTAANRQLTITSDWALETRAAGAIGPLETFYATTQPDGASVLYRMSSDGVVLPVLLTIDDRETALPPARGFIEPAVQPLLPELEIDGAYFAQANGTRWTAIECSDFALFSRCLQGEDIIPVLEQRATYGFNLLRVWTLFDIPGIGCLPVCDYARIPAFVALCASYGLYVEFTAYTGINDPAHWDRLCAAALECDPLPLLELVNELDRNTNVPDHLGRIFELELFVQPPALLLSSRGSNGPEHPPVRPWWSYEVVHTNGAFEWHRKVGHNAMEWSEGAAGAPGSRAPVLSNENTRFPDHCATRTMARDAAAGAALLCAGSCFHSVGGKQSVLWEDVEARAAEAWAAGALSVPLEFQAGRYVHPIEKEAAEDLYVYQRVLPDGRAWTVRIAK